MDVCCEAQLYRANASPRCEAAATTRLHAARQVFLHQASTSQSSQRSKGTDMVTHPVSPVARVVAIGVACELVHVARSCQFSPRFGQEFGLREVDVVEVARGTPCPCVFGARLSAARNIGPTSAPSRQYKLATIRLPSQPRYIYSITRANKLTNTRIYAATRLIGPPCIGPLGFLHLMLCQSTRRFL